jgi:hypothetical protein
MRATLSRKEATCQGGSGRWRQERPNRGVVFLPAQVIQDPVYGVLVFYTGNHPDGTPATPTSLYVNIENSLQSLRPGHRRVTLCWGSDVCIGNLLYPLATPGRCNQPAPAVVRGKDAMVTGEVDPWLRYEGRQTGDEIYRIEGHLCRSIPVRRLQGIDHLTVGAQ